MKKLLILLAMSACCSAWAQDTLMKPMERKKPEGRKEYFRMYLVRPNGIGNNVLAKANDGQGGLGLAVTFYTIDKIHIIGGYDFIQYEVTDPSLAGNIQNTNLATFYLKVLYKIPVIRNVDFNPGFSVGNTTVHQKTHTTSYGKQNGVAVSPGFDIDYRITGGFRIFAGLNYCIAFPKTHTNEEYKSFYSTLQQLNIVFGIKF
ncbi:hypothetical protein AAEO56_00030 [Flavobacterium sp. DGU11]|uniref:Outer membrane protein beta-barrel domain-containing protein n=1 Tax=Flavobacterium arundinis TaxID=3139143 RepID=A0ABU9HR44_9FLAO